MQVNVSGKGIDVGEAFRSHVQSRMEEGVHKYLDRVISVDVVISRDAHLFNVSIHGNTGTSSNIIIKSTGQAVDVYAAFDSAAEKIEKQLSRYKRKITDHHRSEANAYQGMKYVISAAEKAEAEVENPIIIAEKSTHISTLTVSEAVMRMNLADLPALMFNNAANGRLNVVYKRADGNISWVDPAEEKQKVA
jgi:ribosomal subunit interface protein